MRFLHTSDWHVGKALRNRSRDDEYAGALAEVLDIARQEQVDAVLVAGDVFDSAVPSPEAERIVFEFLRELAGARIPAIIVGGNHDHPKRLNAFGQILDLVGIHVRGEPLAADEGGVLELPNRDGSETAVIAVLPWVSERRVRDFESLMKEGEHFADYAEGVARMMAHLASSFRPGCINVLVSHVMLDGAIVGGEGAGERPLHVGQTYAVRPQRLPSEAHYVALGHLHRPQEVLSGRGYYSGSLLQLDFGEVGQQKSVYLVDCAPNRPARVEAVPLSGGRPLRDIGSAKKGLTLEELKPLAQEADNAYLRVFVRVDRPFPGLADQVRELLPNAVDIVVERTDKTEEKRDPDLMRLNPQEMFATYYRQRIHSAEPSKALMDLFNRLYQEVQDEAHQA
jgi:exonuclease SbcD